MPDAFGFLLNNSHPCTRFEGQTCVMCGHPRLLRHSNHLPYYYVLLPLHTIPWTITHPSPSFISFVPPCHQVLVPSTIRQQRYSLRCIAAASMHDTHHTPYLLLVPLNIIAPTPAAAMATPLSIATPSNPSLATLSSMRPLRLPACRFDGSWSRSRSLYLRASA